MTISVILTKIERDFLQFSRENLKTGRFSFHSVSSQRTENMIDWIRKKKPFGLFAQGDGSFVQPLCRLRDIRSPFWHYRAHLPRPGESFLVGETLAKPETLQGLPRAPLQGELAMRSID